MLSTVDIVLLIFILLLFLFLGYFFRNNSNVKEYFLAGSEMTILPVALSISVSLVSSASMTLIIGEVYLYGYPMLLQIVIIPVVTPLINKLVLPSFYNGDFISVYQYLEKRFSRSLRVCNSVIFIITGILTVSTIIYAVSISSEILADLPFWVSVLIVGVLGTTYSAVGGMKGVIWTDVMQSIFMVIFYVLILGKVLLSVGSVAEAWNVAVTGRRVQLSFQEGPHHRYGFLSTISYYIVSMMFFMCMSQPAVQRWKCVPTIEKSKRSILLAFVFIVIFSALTFITGVALFVFYAGCDPLMNNEVGSADKISVYFIRTQLSSYPGLLGLCIAGLLSAALSSMSSFINSFAAVTLEDLVKTLISKPMTNRQELLLCKILTMFYGILCTALVFLVSQSKMVFAVKSIALSTFGGPTLGLLFLGHWCKKSNSKGVGLGFVCSICFVLWMSIGSFRMGMNHEKLSLDISQCTKDNVSYVLRDFNLTSNIEDRRKIARKVMDEEKGGFLEAIYGIAFAWYPLIGLSSTVTLGVIFSLFFEFVSKRQAMPENFVKVTQNNTEILETSFQKAGMF